MPRGRPDRGGGTNRRSGVIGALALPSDVHPPKRSAKDGTSSGHANAFGMVAGALTSRSIARRERRMRTGLVGGDDDADASALDRKVSAGCAPWRGPTSGTLPKALSTVVSC